MRNDLTDITLLIDHSGSMNGCQSDVIGGIKSFIEKQREEPGDATVSLILFSDYSSYVFEAKSIHEVEPPALECGGLTALNDALGEAIVRTGLRLAAMEEDARPGAVLFMLITDGLENQSQKYTSSQVREMIEHQQSKYNWKFTYLGAEHDAHQQAGNLGFASGTVAHFSKGKLGAVAQTMSNYASTVRGMSLADCLTDEPCVYTAAELEEIA
jgi:uncharacterized protein YegL